MSRWGRLQEGPGTKSAARRRHQHDRCVHSPHPRFHHGSLGYTPPPLSEDKGETHLTNQDKEEWRVAVLGPPALGEYVKLEVTIKESYEFKVRSPIRTSVPSLELNSSMSRVRGRPGVDQGSTVECCPSQSTLDKLLKKTNLALVVGANSWREQFLEAITVGSGEVSGEVACPVCLL